MFTDDGFQTINCQQLLNEEVNTNIDTNMLNLYSSEDTPKASK